jgi:hypothetical protein
LIAVKVEDQELGRRPVRPAIIYLPVFFTLRVITLVCVRKIEFVGVVMVE